jgi:hypothetical protein
MINEPTTTESMTVDTDTFQKSIESSFKEAKDLQRSWLLALLSMYESDGEGLLDDLQITLDRGETLEQFADGCLQHLQSNGGLDDPAAEPRKFES